KRIKLEDQNGKWLEVVGVSRNGKYLSISEPPTDFIYLPLSQNFQSRMSLIAESAGEPSGMAGSLKAVVRSIDPNVAIFSVHTMDDVFYQSTVRYLQLLSGGVGAAALVGFFLALVGLYAVVAYQVARSTREIGIRMALGAERLRIMKIVLRQSA